MTIQHSAFETFRATHQGELFVLPNAWDVTSALIYEQAGFPAVATSSAAVAWTLGYADGETLPFADLQRLAGRMATLLNVPVTVDMEAGFGSSPEDIAENICALARLGVAGINLEDVAYGKGEMRPLELQCTILRESKARLDREGLKLFINARTDLLWRGEGGESDRLERTIARGLAFAEAGADAFFAPGLKDLSAIQAVTSAVPLPLNVLVFPSGSGTDLRGKLSEAGVKRISCGSSLYRAAMGHVERLAREVASSRDFSGIFPGAKDYAALQGFYTK